MTHPDPSRTSGAFDELDGRIQQWIWSQAWPALRPAQEQAVGPILAADRDVVICAATAAGKTEAAFLPICSRLLRDRDVAPAAGDNQGDPESDGGRSESGIKVLYVSPLKALINDQWGRLDGLCDHLGIPVHRWHGDVNATHKTRLLQAPDGILIITPESLEAMLVNRGTTIRPLMRSLRYVVIDELHAFLGTQRGAQLQSQLHRIELATRRRIPRIALSATLGDLTEATRYLRPTGPRSVHVIEDHGDGAELRMQLRGYERRVPDLSPPSEDGADDGDEDAPDVSAITAHLFDTLRGSTNLVFANSRRNVEEYADRLAGLAEARRVPNEFFPHHGSLSRSTREDVEALLRAGERPTTVVCTSTLELGIDIGSVASVAQLGAPPSVASLRQRLGRSGRRAGEPATLRLYVTEEEISARCSPTDTIRPELFQTVAMIDLLFEKWFEPLDGGELNLSTLIQQLLSLIAQHGGVRPREAYSALCGPGPFQAVPTGMFIQLLRDMAAHDLIVQAGDGLLLPGERGEKLINHYSFYSAFCTQEEYRLVADGKAIGSIPVTSPIEPGTRIIFSGRRWQVISVDDRQRVIELTRSSGGRPPRFVGSGSRISARVHHSMLRRYLGPDVPIYLDAAAQRLLAEGRDYYRRWRLHRQPAMRAGSDILLFPWEGDRAHDTLALLLTRHGIPAGREGVAINASATAVGDIRDALEAITASPPPNPAELAQGISGAVSDKHDPYLGEELLCAAYAARALDVPAALDTARRLLAVLTSDTVAERPAAQVPASLRTPAADPRMPGPTMATRDTVFSVVDVETTGFSPALGDRIVEIGIVRLAGDGTVLETFETLINPQRPVKATSVHGITDADVAHAPTFADIADDIAARLIGTVVAAHNAPFDLEFLGAEFGRLGCDEPISATACTLQLAHRFVPNLASHTLDACAAAEGIQLDEHHSALADASAAAALLTGWVRRAREDGADTLADLQIASPAHPAAVGATVGTPRCPLTVRVRPYVARPDANDAAPAVVPSVGGQLYELALGQALADGDVADIERRELDLLAAQWGLTTAEQNRLWQAATRRPRTAAPPA